mmetsp:Transcript_85719/g.276638  ORF Transcript_85719/g.276638 Transcript_85719/m.276638 type:complete len:404 (-) Transcript_85719:619-1830(-)
MELSLSRRAPSANLQPFGSCTERVRKTSSRRLIMETDVNEPGSPRSTAAQKVSSRAVSSPMLVGNNGDHTGEPFCATNADPWGGPGPPSPSPKKFKPDLRCGARVFHKGAGAGVSSLLSGSPSAAAGGSAFCAAFMVSQKACMRLRDSWIRTSGRTSVALLPDRRANPRDASTWATWAPSSASHLRAAAPSPSGGTSTRGCGCCSSDAGGGATWTTSLPAAAAEVTGLPAAGVSRSATSRCASQWHVSPAADAREKSARPPPPSPSRSPPLSSPQSAERGLSMRIRAPPSRCPSRGSTSAKVPGCTVKFSATLPSWDPSWLGLSAKPMLYTPILQPPMCGAASHRAPPGGEVAPGHSLQIRALKPVPAGTARGFFAMVKVDLTLGSGHRSTGFSSMRTSKSKT